MSFVLHDSNIIGWIVPGVRAFPVLQIGRPECPIVQVPCYLRVVGGGDVYGIVACRWLLVRFKLIS